MHYINISFTKSWKSKIFKSFSPSPTPKNLTGFCNSDTIGNIIPPFAVPSNLVNIIPDILDIELNILACSNQF